MSDLLFQVGLEDLTEKFKTGGLTCATRFLQGTHQSLLKVVSIIKSLGFLEVKTVTGDIVPLALSLASDAG